MTTTRHGLGGLLRRPIYRRLWLARTVSQVGDVAQLTILAVLLVALTGSGLGVSGAERVRTSGSALHQGAETSVSRLRLGRRSL